MSARPRDAAVEDVSDVTAGPEQTAAASAVSSRGLAGATRWMVIGRLVTQVSRFGVAILLARLLTPEAFGIVAVAMTTILALEVLKDLGTGAAVIQQRTVDQHLLSSVFYLNVLTGVVCAAIMAIGAPVIAGLFSTPEATPVVRALSLILLLSGLSQTHHAVLRRKMRFSGVAAVEIAGALVTGAVSIALALAGAGVWAMVWGNLSGVVAGTIVAWTRSGWHPTVAPSVQPLRRIASFSLHTAAFNATNFLLQNTDKLLVGRWLGAGPLGIYSLGQRTISYPVESIAHVLMTVLFPAFARVQDDDALLRKGYARALGTIAFLTFPIMVGTAVVAEPLVHVALGAEWLELIPLLWFMAPAGAVAALLSAVNTLYSAKGRADGMFRWGLASGTATLLAFAIGLQWGLAGLAVAYLIVMVVQAPIGFAIVLRLINMRLRDLMRALAPYALMTLVMAVAAGTATYGVAAMDGSRLVQLVAGVVTGVLVYLGMALLLRPAALADVRQVAAPRRTSR